MRIVIVNALVCCIDDRSSADGRIQLFTEPHAYPMRGDREHRIFRGVRPEQDSMRFTYGGKGKCQAEGKENSDEKTTLSSSDVQAEHHEPHPNFFKVFFLFPLYYV